ncbi:hypothetical protein Emed_006361 [Eimeria media]
MVQLIFSRQVAVSLPIFLLYVSLHYGTLAWGSSDTTSGDLHGPQHGIFTAPVGETTNPRSPMLPEGTEAYKEATPHDRGPRHNQPLSLNQQQRVQESKEFVVNPTTNSVHELRVVSKECNFTAGLQKTHAILRQMFAGSCPLNWQPLSEGEPRMQPGQVNQASSREAQSAEDLHQPSSVLPGELRLHSHSSRLRIGEIITIFAEVLDTRGQLYPTDCGSVSLQLLQPGNEDFDSARKPLVSGLGVQLLKGGRARWRLKIDNFASSLLALQAIPRLCTTSLANGSLLFDSLPGSLVLPTVLALEVISPEEEGIKVPKRPQIALSGGTQLVADEDAHGPTPKQSGIAKVELLTEAKSFQECCNQQTSATQGKLAASSDQEVSLPGAESHRSSNTRCGQQPPDMSVCEPLTLIYEVLEPGVTAESPVFVYSFHLSHKPSVPVNISIFPTLESSREAEDGERRQLVNFSVDEGDAFARNEHLQLFVGDEAFMRGTNVRLEPEDWNKPVIVAVKLSTALAKSAAAQVKAGGARLFVGVKHIILADASDDQEGVMFPATDVAFASAARTVSIRCTVHTYVDDVLVAGSHKRVDELLGVRPISVRCHIQPSDDVDGEIHINVSGGSAIRLLSPKPGSGLVLMREEGEVAKSGSLVSTVREELKNDPTGKTNYQDAASLSSNKHAVEWSRAEVDALLFPGDMGCSDTACTLIFDLGSRDERRGGDLRLLPFGGKVALLPNSSTKHDTPLEGEPEQLKKRLTLSRQWVIMTKNQVQAELRVLDGPSPLEEVLADCIKASCFTAETYPVEASVRCVAEENVEQLHGTHDTIDLYITLKPAVSSSCLLLHPSGEEIGKLQVIATTSALCDESSFYNRDTATCQQCPRGFGCSRGRLLQCAESEKGKGEFEDCPLCLDGNKCDARYLTLVGAFGSTPLWRCGACTPPSLKSPLGKMRETANDEALTVTESAGEAVVDDYDGGGRRCSPHAPPSASPSALLGWPSTGGSGNGLRQSGSESQICHTHITDPECPEGGICWAGKFFPCPRLRVLRGRQKRRVYDLTLLGFLNSTGIQGVKRKSYGEDKSSTRCSSPCVRTGKRKTDCMSFQGNTEPSVDTDVFAEAPSELVHSRDDGGTMRAPQPRRAAVCSATSVFCRDAVQLLIPGLREESTSLSNSPMVWSIQDCDPKIGICESGSVEERPCPPGYYADPQGEQGNLTSCTVCPPNTYCHAYHIQSGKSPPYHGNILPEGTA